jgi:hypothetical protein
LIRLPNGNPIRKAHIMNCVQALGAHACLHCNNSTGMPRMGGILSRVLLKKFSYGTYHATKKWFDGMCARGYPECLGYCLTRDYEQALTIFTSPLQYNLVKNLLKKIKFSPYNSPITLIILTPHMRGRSARY